ncbi:MAG: Hsp70 family protein [Chitinivibrionales bacterium]|nr:Hsp70 family protein [Chitinivibrionales bacterium]
MDTIVGIDLGTTNSEIAYVKDGEARIIPVKGEKMMPSCVSVDEQNRLLIGRAAKNQMVLHAESTILSIKRKMGLNTTVSMGEGAYSPEQISALILGELKREAEAHLNAAVTKAVITVPAYFNDDQRKATKTAGEIAGLDVVRILNEPTAAALTYESGHQENGKIMVYDLGGGTFDVSVLVVENGVLEVKSSHGDTHLGGDDFDQCIINHLAQVFKTKSGIDPLADIRAKNRLWKAAEWAKIQLSDHPFVQVREEFLCGDYHLDAELSRAEYERMISPYLERTMQCVHTALKDAHFLPRDIDTVILAGGATRTPMVWQQLRTVMQTEPLQAIDPDLIVALGAALQGATIAGHSSSSVLVDITPHTFGTAAIGIVEGVETFNKFVPVIKRNTPLPVQKSELFYTAIDNQEGVEVSVYQGEREYASQNTHVGKFLISGLSRVPAGNRMIFTLNLDLNGILEVTAMEKDTGLSKSVKMNPKLSRKQFNLEEARRTIAELESGSEHVAAAGGEGVNDDDGDDDLSYDDLEEAQVVDEQSESGQDRQALLQHAKTLRKRAEALMDKLETIDKTEIESLLEQTKNAIHGADDRRLKDLNDSLSDMLFYLED